MSTFDSFLSTITKSKYFDIFSDEMTVDDLETSHIKIEMEFHPDVQTEMSSSRLVSPKTVTMAELSEKVERLEKEKCELLNKVDCLESEVNEVSKHTVHFYKAL